MKLKKIFRAALFSLALLLAAFISFVLYETKDDINADLDNIENKLSAFYNEKKMGGFAVSVFNDETVFYSQGFGYADLQNKIPYTTKTEQYIASVSKTSIGVAVLKAQDLGLLNINDPINLYLPFNIYNPDFPDHEINIKQLATHTSSLDYNESVVESLYISEAEKQQSLDTFMEDYFQNRKYGAVKFTKHEPGTNWNYSNIGASLAAYVIERKSGMTYADFTKKYIFEPLEMNNTHWFESEADQSHYSKYYELKSDDVLEEVNTSGVQLYPSRDLITNVEDLTTFCQAIIAKRPEILSMDAYEAMLQPQLSPTVSNQTVDNHGIFWMTDRNQFGVTYQLTGMNGGDYCINAMMWFDPKTKLGYLFIGNTGQTKANRLNHVFIYRALVSLGDHILRDQTAANIPEKIAYQSHNIYSRFRALF